MAGVNSPQNKLNLLEAKLAGTLKPVQPSHAFVNTLRKRINIATPAVVVDRVRDTESLVLIIGGVLSAVLILITGTRALYYLLVRSK